MESSSPMPNPYEPLARPNSAGEGGAHDPDRAFKAAAMRWIFGSIAIGVFAVGFMPAGRADRIRRTCVICRLRQTNASGFGCSRSPDEYPNECSRWYEANVGSAHEHVWEKDEGGGTDDGAILYLPSDLQMKVYQHFRDPRTAESLFLGFADEVVRHARPSGCNENWGRLRARAVMEWVQAGFPSTWDEWWAASLARCASKGKGRMTTPRGAEGRPPASRGDHGIGIRSRQPLGRVLHWWARGEAKAACRGTAFEKGEVLPASLVAVAV